MQQPDALDDLGHVVAVSPPARRVVSLVPSLTEALVAARRESVIAATDWCTHPADLDVIRVRGTKNPDIRAIIALTPDLVAAATADDPARVINIGSIDGMHVPIYENYAYAASKAALHHLTSVLAGRLAVDNITVNAVAPGPFESKMMRSTLEEHGADLVTRIPLGRIGRSDDMAGIALFLASRAGAYLTGALIPVDGGQTNVR